MIDEQSELITFEMDAETYKIMHRILDSVTDKCGVVFSEEGLSSITVDPANVGMGSLNIGKNAFVEYNLMEGQENPLEIGFDLGKLKELGLLEDYNNGNVRFTIFKYKGKNKFDETKTMCNVHHDIFNNTIELPPISEMRVPKGETRMPTEMPSFKKTCSFVIDKQTLAKVATRMVEGDSGIIIVCNKNSVNFTDSTPSTCTTDKIPINETGEAHCQYSSDYLSDFIEAIPDNTPIVFSYKTDFPCEIKIKFAEDCVATWMIAPRLEVD